MNNLIKLIKNFDGILGAVISIIGGLIVSIITYIWRSCRNLNIGLRNWKVYGSIINELGEYGYEEATSLKYEDIYVKTEVEIYNACDDFKIMRNIKIVFYNNKIKLFDITPYDDDNSVIIADKFKEGGKVSIINIEGKKCIVKKFNFRIIDTMKYINNVTAVYLEYTDYRNKHKKCLIKENII